MSHPHEGMLKTLYDAFAKGDMETVMALFTDDIKFHVFGGSRWRAATGARIKSCASSLN
jgi:ketosteroid isomerase-like protein